MRARSCNAQCTAQIWDICRYSVSLQKASGQRANRCTESRDIQSDAAALLVSASTDGFVMGMVIKYFKSERHTRNSGGVAGSSDSSELPSIVFWLLDGLRQIEHGFSRPKIGAQATNTKLAHRARPGPSA